MLSRRHRFHGHASLGAVYRRGLTVRHKEMALKYVRNDRRTEYRAAVIVSRKVHKLAVQRNRVRRRIYEIIRAVVPPAIPYDFVLTVFDETIVDSPPEKLHNMIVSLFKKARISPVPKLTSPEHDIVEKREEGR